VTAQWVRCSGLTLGVLVDASGVIVDAPSLVDGFIGQPFHNLLQWIERFETPDLSIDANDTPAR
jgi:hypothetical protein